MGLLALRSEFERFNVLVDLLVAERVNGWIIDAEWEAARQVEYWCNDLGRFVGRIYKVANVKPKPKTEAPEFKGFVNYVLSADDKAGFSEWGVDDHDLFVLVASDIHAGYKLSCSFNPKNDTFVASYICNDPTSPNAGYLLSAYAPDWYNALKALVYKHNIVLGFIWGGQQSKDVNSWG